MKRFLNTLIAFKSRYINREFFLINDRQRVYICKMAMRASDATSHHRRWASKTLPELKFRDNLIVTESIELLRETKMIEFRENIAFSFAVKKKQNSSERCNNQSRQK